jgi:glycosyltransferase involved in cell wall biosynthesis
MTCPLAIFAPQLGVPSETFIRRHMADLLPGRTAVVANTALPAREGPWTFDGPLLLVDRDGDPTLPRLVLLGIGRRLGLRLEDPREGAIRRFFRRHRVQVVMGEYLDSSLPLLTLARRLGLRFWVHAHGYDVSRMLREPGIPEAYRRFADADGVITMSEASRRRLVALGLPSAKVHVVPYGVDLPAEPCPRPTGPATASDGEVRCLAVGRMVAKKAPIFVLDALRRAGEKSHRRLHLDYVGAGDLLPAAQQFVRAFGLEDRVTLHGGVHGGEVRRLLERADIFVQHSITDPLTGDEEGLPVAILEAMALTLPVVSTTHAGIPEAVIDGVTGCLVDEGDIVGMADRIVTLAEDTGLRSRMGIAGWERVKRFFTWERERADLLRLLKPEPGLH